jgi:SAM-dependent methyltransferase
VFTTGLSADLIREWGLTAEETHWIERQNLDLCVTCGSNMRTRVLAAAVLRWAGHSGPFARWARSIRGRLTRILEINSAGQISQFFPRTCRRVLGSYPDLDMTDMKNIRDGSYDLVIHSDTLEHVPDPVRGLSECRRILRRGGGCCFTVPIVPTRLTRTREGLPPSYHGRTQGNREDYLVYTEYGSDAWRHVLEAGFSEVRIVGLDTPTAHALTGIC